MPENNYFSCSREKEIEAAGGFFCQACCVARPVDDQSRDPRYCQGCYEVLKREAEQLTGGRKAAWIPKSKKRVVGRHQNTRQAKPAAREPVAKIPGNGNGGGVEIPKVIMQQKKRGRPVKAGGVHRATLWRRKQKAKQGVLL